MKRAIVLAVSLLLRGNLPAASIDELCTRYLDRYFEMFPTRATMAGRHDFDSQLEDFSNRRISDWVEFNRKTQADATGLMEKGIVSPDERLDAEALLGQIARELNGIVDFARPERDPLYWSSVVGDATVFLLVRDDLPEAERQARARARAKLLAGFANAGKEHFAHADPAKIAPELCEIAANQLRASAKFYAEGFHTATNGDEGVAAASALNEFADAIAALGKRATGSARLGEKYAASFRAGTRIEEPVTQVLDRAVADLAKTRAETASYSRTIWRETMGDAPLPKTDAEVVTAMFERIGADRDRDVDEALAHWRENVSAINDLVHTKKIMSLPDPLTLVVDISPPFFVGQSVGGVYPPGPYAPEAKTILFIPSPGRDAPPAARDAFFRDFNKHFNKMIVPHELIPGHYVQFKVAARQPHKIRAVFPDPLYVEGWGTFCERMLLDQGWGGPLERIAHLKKQLENIARTIVDIRVHTTQVSRDEVVRFVKEEALQGDQLASNMWTRSLTTSPQITTYYLGYAKVRKAYERAQGRQREHFDLRAFMDGMMALGPVQLDHYIERAEQQSY